MEKEQEVPGIYTFQCNLVKYNIYILTPTEYKRRFTIFQENLKKAKKMKEMDRGDAQYGVTQFMDMTG